MVTIKDVARDAGLSVTTVSRALNNHDDVAEETRARIQAVARRLDYHPNMVARSLQKNHANAIGLIIPLILHRQYDPFWLEFIGGMASACSARGSDLVVSAADAANGTGPGFQRLLRGRRVDGMVICDVRRSDPRIAQLQKHRLPFVAFGRTVGPQDYAFVDVDGGAGVGQAMEHLFRLGHRRIAYLGVDPDFGFSHYRLAGYRQALTRAGVAYDPELVAEGLTEVTVPAAIRAMLALEDPPTAVFAAADFLALATLREAREAGLCVPLDLSLCVFDDSPLVQHAEPPLTTVSQPNQRLGEEAAALLLELVAHRGAPLMQRLVVPTLTIRGSTAPPASKQLCTPTEH